MEHVPAYFCLLESDHKEKDSVDKMLVQKSSINRKYAAWLNPSPVELGFISFRSQSEAREVLYGDLFGRGIALVKLVRWKIFGRGHDGFLFNVDLLCQGPDTVYTYTKGKGPLTTRNHTNKSITLFRIYYFLSI